MPPIVEQEVRFPRLTSCTGRFLQLFCAFAFSLYPLVGVLGLAAAVTVYGIGAVSGTSIAAALFLYFLQLYVWQPQFTAGTPATLLHGWLAWACDHVLHYYDATVVRRGPAPDPNGRYLFTMFPHGVFGVCRAFSGGNACWKQLYPGIDFRWGSFGAAFFIPGIREFSLLAGCVDASKRTLLPLIEHGHNIMLLPGGIDEMALTDGRSSVTQLVLEDRMGYAKLAIETGCDIVPCFCFGEKWVHRKLLLPAALRGWLYRRFRVSGTLLAGRWGTFLGFLGFPLAMVYGEPIKVTRQADVDPEYLRFIHAQVKASVKDIFNCYKERFGYAEEETLEFVTVAQARGSQTSGKGKKAL